MKNRILYLAALSLTVALVSCGDLDRFPKSKIPPENFFSTEQELEYFSNTFYTVFPAASIYSDQVDDILHNSLREEMRDGRSIPSEGSQWTWGDLRKFNTLLEYSHQCNNTEVRERYDAVARFFRAYFYFMKVRRFGDVPWYEATVGSADAELYKPRDSRELVMQKIIEDLDYAITKLPTAKDTYKVTKWTAMALKSRVCLFEGTFRKYHGIEIEGGEDWKYYLEQCAEASLEFIQTSGYGLYTGDITTVYRDLFATLEARSAEIILARDYNVSLNVVHNANFYTMSPSQGRPGLSKKVVDSYLMKDGSRFTAKTDYQKILFREEFENRDPRLSQTIRTPGYTRLGTTVLTAPDLSSSVTGYQPIKYVMGTAYDTWDKSGCDLPLFRTAEVYLNYAEAKAELETLTQADIDLSVKKLRDRVGMPNIDLNAANADPDTYLSSPETGYPNVTGDNKGVILEIRRERTIELIMEGHRYYDIMRWKEGGMFAKPLLGMYVPSPGTYDLDGNGTDDVEFYTASSTSGSSTVKLKIGEDVFLTDGNSGNISPYKNMDQSWNEDRDYLFPIPTEERSLTNGAITQNPGWIDNLEF